MRNYAEEIVLDAIKEIPKALRASGFKVSGIDKETRSLKKEGWAIDLVAHVESPNRDGAGKKLPYKLYALDIRLELLEMGKRL